MWVDLSKFYEIILYYFKYSFLKFMISYYYVLYWIISPKILAWYYQIISYIDVEEKSLILKIIPAINQDSFQSILE